MRRHVLFALLLTTACGTESASLVLIEVTTDYLPGEEFDEVSLWMDDVEVASVRASNGDPYIAGERVAELDVPRGFHRFVVNLVTPGGNELASRAIALNVQAPALGLNAVIARSCGAACPGSADPEDATECYGNRCVPPSCRPNDPESCGEGECATDADCAVVSCAVPVCVAGECLAGLDSGRCGPLERCHPERGCIPDAIDAGPGDGGPGDGGPGDSGPGDSGTTDAGPTDAPSDVPSDTPSDVGIDAPLDAGPDTFDAGCVNGTTRDCPPGVGVCGGGRETCVSGTWDGICVGAITPAPYEECFDGVDANCNGDASDTEDCCFTEMRAGRTYVFCNRGRRTHGGATMWCRDLPGDFDLAAVNDESESDFVRDQAASVPYWIGLFESVEGTYIWHSGEPFGAFTNWGPLQPDDTGDHDCVLLDGDTGTWDDVRCSGAAHSYICESLP